MEAGVAGVVGTSAKAVGVTPREVGGALGGGWEGSGGEEAAGGGGPRLELGWSRSSSSFERYRRSRSRS